MIGVPRLRHALEDPPSGRRHADFVARRSLRHEGGPHRSPWPVPQNARPDIPRPVLVARQLADISIRAPGRFLFGVGIGSEE